MANEICELSDMDYLSPSRDGDISLPSDTEGGCTTPLKTPLQFQNIRPSPLRLIVLTSCNCSLGCNININVIYDQLNIDDVIKTIKLKNEVKGEIKQQKKKQKKKTKGKDKKKKHFINQITVVIAYQNQSINVKLFGNGKIVITGAKNKDNIKVMLELLIDRIKNLTLSYQLDTDSNQMEGFANSIELIKFFEKNYLLTMQLLDMFHLKIPINWHEILVNKNRNKMFDKGLSTEEYIKDHLFYQHDESQHDGYLKELNRIIQTIRLVKLYSYNILPEGQMTQDITQYFAGKKVQFPISYESFPDQDQLKVVVNNYNALFESNVKFDREKFHHVLTNKCQILVNFRPSSYQGLNITYYFDFKGNNEKVTFFAFQDGTIMITGNNDWEVIEQSYLEMCKIIDTYYSEIINNERKITKDLNYPVKFDMAIDGQNYIFINKRSAVINNPRNNYILKKMGLINLYS